jgi:RNA polymerase sigma-70 factor, ECF subfamily
MIAGFIASIITDVHDADDVLQDVALVTARRFGEYDKKRPFVAWAIGIAKNVMLQHFRDRKSRILGGDAIEQIAELYRSDDSGGTDMTADRVQAMRLCMERLSARWRTVLEMYYLRDMAPARIAGGLGTSRGNVFVILHRGRIALRECVEQQLHQESV